MTTANGAPGRTRTLNLLIRSQALYPIELRTHIVLVLQIMKNIINLIVQSDEKDLRIDLFLTKKKKN